MRGLESGGRVCIMKSHTYEIEIKSLLGDNKRADSLKDRMKELDPHIVYAGKHAQLNHYFIGGDLKKLFENVSLYINPKKRDLFKEIAYKAKDYSLRSRCADGLVMLVIKASMDDTTSANGIVRVECEATTPDLSLDALDNLILESGLTYQAKWSREREAYIYRGVNVTIDKNAGYGYVAEFEYMITDAAQATEAQTRLRAMMGELGVSELPQDRLERMFAHYNAHWQEYYGTDKIFVIA